MWYEVHPTPAKDKDGKNLVYVRPLSGRRMTMKQLEGYSERNFNSRYGELTRAFDVFIRAASEFLAEGYRIETPIGTFAPKLSLKRQVSDADKVRDRDVLLDGVEYTPGKLWQKEMAKWHDGFRRVHTPNSGQLLADRDKLEQTMRKALSRNNGYITVNIFAACSGLTRYSARKLLDEWTTGPTPKLLKTKQSKVFIYTEV